MSITEIEICNKGKNRKIVEALDVQIFKNTLSYQFTIKFKKHIFEWETGKSLFQGCSGWCKVKSRTAIENSRLLVCVIEFHVD